MEQRFLSYFREDPTNEPGLVLEADGTVWLVEPGGTRTELVATSGIGLPPQWTADDTNGAVRGETVDGNHGPVLSLRSGPGGDANTLLVLYDNGTQGLTVGLDTSTKLIGRQGDLVTEGFGTSVYISGGNAQTGEEGAYANWGGGSAGTAGDLDIGGGEAVEGGNVRIRGGGGVAGGGDVTIQPGPVGALTLYAFDAQSGIQINTDGRIDVVASSKIDANGSAVSLRGGASVVAAGGAVEIIGGSSTGDAGGNVTISGGAGDTSDGSVFLLDAQSNIIFQVDDQALGFFSQSPVGKQTVTGALSTVADAAAKNVLTSLLSALVQYGLAIDGTT
jgi:hypothetical protein